MNKTNNKTTQEAECSLAERKSGGTLMRALCVMFMALGFLGLFPPLTASADEATPKDSTATDSVSLKGSGTAEDPYLIGSAADQEEFANLVGSGKTAICGKLINDVDLGNSLIMIGTLEQSYSGTYDGGGYTLTVNLSGWGVAPFYRVKGATIKNLKVAGKINGQNHPHSSGLVAQCSDVNIDNVEVAAHISFTKKEDTYSGGFIGHGLSSKINISNSIFSGSFSGATNFAAFVGWSDNPTITMDRCLEYGTYTDLYGLNAFTRNNGGGTTTVTNSFYANRSNVTVYDKANGKLATADQLKSGEVAWELQNGNDTQTWGEIIDKDTIPFLTSSDTARVYKITINYDGKEIALQYLNKTGKVKFPESTDYGYDEFTYKTADGKDFTATSAITGDMALTATGKDFFLEGEGTEKSPYVIATVKNWEDLSKYIEKGNATAGKFFMQKGNLDLGESQVMIGSDKYPFEGTYDGQGDTLTVAYNVAEAIAGPFRYIQNATIKNLHTAGTLNTTYEDDVDYVGGVVGYSKSGSTNFLTAVSSSMKITSSRKGDITSGGLMGVAQNTTTLTDCYFDGSFDASEAKGVGELVGWANGTLNINNCYSAGTFNIKADASNACFARYNSNQCKVYVTNSYYLNALNFVQGIAKDEGQFKSGEVAYLLNNNRENQVWGQEISKDLLPILSASADKHVYKVSFDMDSVEFAAAYANKNGNVAIPTVDLGYENYSFKTDDGSDFTDKTAVTEDVTVTVTGTGFALSGDGSEKTPYVVATVKDWENLSKYIENGLSTDGKFFSQTKNIDLGNSQAMLGTPANPFAGIYNGKDSTLTVAYASDKNFIAPFRYISGALIENLHTAGTISSTITNNTVFAGGVVSKTMERSTNTLTRVSSSVKITAVREGDITSGGLMALAQDSTILNECYFNGSFEASKSRGVGGFIGWTNGSLNINNCYNYGTFNVNSHKSNATFARYSSENAKVKIDNSYYLNAINNAQGTLMTEEQFKSGEVAYKLNNNRENQVWGQTIGKDATPVLSAATEKHVYKVDFKYEDKDLAVAYTNTNGNVELPSIAEYGYTTGDYKTADGEEFTATTAVTSDLTVTVTGVDFFLEGEGTEASPYVIATVKNWEDLSKYIENGNTTSGKFFKQTKNINLGDVQTMVGTSGNPFAGTYDGGDSTLTVAYNVTEGNVAPFRFVSGVTIKNLHTAGTIKSTFDGMFPNAGGVVSHVNGGTNKLANVGSSMKISATRSGDITSAGLIANVASTTTIDDCYFDGSFDAANSSCVAGLVGWSSAKLNINNCYSTGTFNVKAFNDNHNFSRGTGTITITNSYYLNGFNNIQGTAMSKDQFASGEVAHKLNNNRDVQVWGQAIGTDPAPVFSADAAKHVYEVSFNMESKKIVAIYVNTGGKVAVPNLDLGYKSYTYKTSEGADFTGNNAVNSDIAVIVTGTGFFLTGEGTEKSPYLVETAQNLKDLSKYVNNGTPTAGKYYSQTADFDMTDIADYEPMGYTSLFQYAKGDADVTDLGFAGVYDGNGNKISNVTMAQIKQPISVGVFGTVTGTVKNLWIDNFTYAGEGKIDTRVGALVGQLLTTNGLVTDCKVTNSSLTNDNYAVGGAIAGAISGATMEYCYAIGNTLAFMAERQGYLAGDTKNDVGWAGTVNYSYTDASQNFSTEKGHQGNGQYFMNNAGESQYGDYFLTDFNFGTEHWTYINGALPELKAFTVVISEDTDNVIVDNPGRAAVVERTLQPNVWYSLVVPFSLTAEQVNAAFGDSVKVARFSNDTQDRIDFNTSDDKTINANEPVIIQTTAEVKSPAFANCDIIASENTSISGAQGVDFIGLYTTNDTIKAGDYFIAQNKLWKSEGKTTMKATQAYFTAPTDAAKVSLFIDGEEMESTTGIDGVKIEEGRVMNHSVYTLSGQKVADSIDDVKMHNLPAGVYIVNGKKVIMK